MIKFLVPYFPPGALCEQEDRNNKKANKRSEFHFSFCEKQEARLRTNEDISLVKARRKWCVAPMAVTRRARINDLTERTEG